LATLAERRVQRARAVAADRWFFSGMAALLFVTMFVGFAPSYYLHGAPNPDFGSYLDTPPQPIRGLFLLHGAVFTAWFLLQLIQSLLVAGKKLAVHKLVGETAMVLAPLIVIVSILVVFYTTRHVFHGETKPTVQSAAFPLSLVTWFSGFVIAGMLLRRKPEAHKRLMLLASLAIISPAVGRIDWLPYPDWLPNWWEWAIVFAMPLVVWDLVRLRRLHPATLIGVPVFIAMFPVQYWVRSTPWWMHMIATVVS
jgi:hypothetical protein